MTGALPYVWARSLECAYYGVRLVQRRLPHPATGAPRRPAFGVPDGCIALTIDDGPDPQWTPLVLDVLARHDVPATFFLIGARVGDNPALAARISAAGHAVGNHSMHHPLPFAALAAHRVGAEIDQAHRAIEDATGATPRLFRAPGGGWSSSVLRAVARRGMTPVDWTLNSSDWKLPGVVRIARSLCAARPGQILLCHDGGGDRSQTVAALNMAIPVLKQHGLCFTTVAPGPSGLIQQ